MQHDEESLLAQRRNLTQQIFQLAYFGKISPEYASSLEIAERMYLFELLSEQIKKENKQQEQAASKTSSKTPRIPSRGRR